MIRQRGWLLGLILVTSTTAITAAALIGASGIETLGARLTLTDRDGAVLLARTWPEFDLTMLPLASNMAAEGSIARLEGYWYLDEPRQLDLWVKADGFARVAIDGRPILERRADATSRGIRRTLYLEAGFRRIDVLFRPNGQTTFFKLQAADRGEAPRGIPFDELYARPSDPGHRTLTRRLFQSAALAWLACGVGVVGFAARQRFRAGAWPRWWVLLVLPALITGYATVLRFDAVVTRYWSADAPYAVRILQRQVAAIRPPALRWGPEPNPYQGDPFTYLRMARASRTFYQPSGREPVFVFTAKLLLPLVGNHDVAVNFASALFSAATVPMTYALGLAAFSPPVGLIASGLLAVERYVIAVSAEGWRDDAFAFFFMCSALATLRFRRRPSVGRGLALGACGGLASLTRITSLSFFIPSLGLVAVQRSSREALRAVAASTVLAAVLISPFLVACWLAYGDPFHAINVHTRYYRTSLGIPGTEPMSWTTYLNEMRPPVETLDTFLVGLTAHPFTAKWQGFDHLHPLLGPVLGAAALIGLGAFTRSRTGRLLLLLLVTSLVPFAFTWDLPGGRDWRMTLHAYPLYLIAAALTIASLAAGAIAGPARWRELWRLHGRRWLLVSGLWVSCVAGMWIVGVQLYAARIAETLERGREFALHIGPRDRAVLSGGWSLPQRTGGTLERTCHGRCELRLPLRASRSYELILRARPEHAEPVTVSVAVNGRAAASFMLTETVTVGVVPLAQTRLRDGANRVVLGVAKGHGLALRGLTITPTVEDASSREPPAARPRSTLRR